MYFAISTSAILVGSARREASIAAGSSDDVTVVYFIRTWIKECFKKNPPLYTAHGLSSEGLEKETLIVSIDFACILNMMMILGVTQRRCFMEGHVEELSS